MFEPVQCHSSKRKRRDVTSVPTKKEYDMEQGPILIISAADQESSSSGGIVDHGRQRSGEDILGTYLSF